MKIPEMVYGRISFRQKQILLDEFSFILLGAVLLFFLAVWRQGILLFQLLRIVLGLLYILFIPGYCLTTAIFPRAHDVVHVERLGLSIGFSIACVSVLALILNRLPWGLSFWPILLSEYMIIGLFAAVTIWRRSQLRLGAASTIESTWQLRRWWNSLSVFEQRLYKILAGGMLVTLGLAILTFWLPTSGKFVTEFYILGKDGFIENYPYKMSIDDPVTVTIGVVNHERAESKYRIEVWITDSLNGEHQVRVTPSPEFLLQPGEKYEQPVSWHMRQVGDDQKVELLLFYKDNIAPYRRLQMWINVGK
jgi:uncharacterized membrane protein